MADFTASLMSDGERIIVERRQHWLVLVDRSKLAILGLVVALLIFIFRGNLGTDGIGGGINFILGWVVLALVVYAVVIFVYQYLHWVNDAFIVTSRRVIQIQGILNKKALDSSLEKINDAVLTENVFGRMFGFGDLEILTASDSGIDRMHMLVDASGFKRAMTEAKHDLELEVSSGRIPSPPLRATAPAGPGAPAAPVAPPDPAPAPAVAAPAQPAAPAPNPDDVANAINRLKGLLDSGAITQAEFDAKKAELLARL
ncbi:MAG TPA: PH domain-containing protein [Candidatus Limnocylindrales bacterium]|nr:PH domain-containing protein [Candidatus Limnocylindrales bacterium]